MMSPRLSAALVVAAASFVCTEAQAQTATQTVTYQVAAVDVISVSGSPSLVINSATAGSGLTAASASGTYAVTSNGTGRKITAQLDTNMPAGVTLTANMAAPTGGTSAGVVTLTSIAANMVTGISTVDQSGLAITYGLSATVAAGVVAQANKTVTYTITTGP